MNTDLAWLTAILASVWFLVYWIFGGVAFALLLLLRLGRVRKVRFSCLFSVYALFVAVGAACGSVAYSGDAVAICLDQAVNRAQIVSAIFGCGFVGIVGGFGCGLLALFLGGLLLMLVSRRGRNPGGPTVADDGMPSVEPARASSKYF